MEKKWKTGDFKYFKGGINYENLHFRKQEWGFGYTYASR